MSEITRRWSGYICPDCRFVFRVPKDHDGVGLVCPSCRRLLRIPAPGEPLPPLFTPATRLPSLEPLDTVVESETPGGEKLRRRRRSSREKGGATPAWERAFRVGSRHSEKLLMAVMVAAALLLLAGVLIVSGRSKSGGAPAAPANTAQQPASMPDAAEPPKAAAFLPDIGEFLRLAEPLARTFLNATTIPDAVACVRHPEVTASRLASLHPDGKLQPVGLQSFADNGAVALESKTAVVRIRTGNFEQRDLSFYRTGDGWRIDWESWAGWSEVPWDTFAEKCPVTPARFRVRLKPIVYYNFGFTDDAKWRSYLIESPDGNHRFFGYVERGSRVDNLINFADNPAGGDFIVELRFPSDNAGRNQVLITDRIADSWVEPDPADSP